MKVKLGVIAYLVVFLLACQVQEFGLGETVFCASAIYWLPTLLWLVEE